MSTYTFNLQIVVPQAWSLLLFFLAQLILLYGRQRFVQVFESCINKMTEVQSLRKKKIVTSLLYAVILLLVLFLCYNYFPITVRSVVEKEVEIIKADDEEVVIVQAVLPIQPIPEKSIEDVEVIVPEPLAMPTNTFNLLIVVMFLSLFGGLVVIFRENVSKMFMLSTGYFHVVSGWLGEGREKLVNMYMCCTQYFHAMSGFGGKLVDLFSQWRSKKKVDNFKTEAVKTSERVRPTPPISANTYNVEIPAISFSFLGGLMVSIRRQLCNIYTFCTKCFHVMCGWIGNLLKLVKQSNPLPREINMENKVDPKIEVKPDPEIEGITIDPNENEGLKSYIQKIIESLESLGEEIQRPLLAENDVTTILTRVDEIPGLIQKSISSLEIVHGKLYSSI